MPKYRYTGTGPCRYGAMPLRQGDVVDASAKPGKNFALVEAVTTPVSEQASRRGRSSTTDETK